MSICTHYVHTCTTSLFFLQYYDYCSLFIQNLFVSYFLLCYLWVVLWRALFTPPYRFITPIVQNFQSQYIFLSILGLWWDRSQVIANQDGVDKLMGQQMAEFDAFGIQMSYWLVPLISYDFSRGYLVPIKIH